MGAFAFAGTAQAQQRTITVTLATGQKIEIAIDLPPGTPLDNLKIPGINTPILSISDSATAPAGPTGPTGPSGPSGAPSAGTPSAPTVTGKPSRQRDKVSAHRKAVEQAVANTIVRTKAAKRRATKFQQANGTPTPFDGSYSFAIPGAAPIGVSNFFIDKFRIPPFLLSIYQAAGVQYGVRWEILAAINEIETDYGRNLNVSSAGALGWMQFLPSTWKRYGVDANRDGKKDPYNPVDAIFGAARYLKAAGADTNIKKAIFAYNHADWYVESVLMRARLIGGLPADLVGSLTGLTQGHFPVHAVSRYAESGKSATNIYSKAGAPAIAVQDGKIVGMGKTWVKLRDVYGNTYIYKNLKTVSRSHVVPKDQAITAEDLKRSLELPKTDPAPTVPASAGTALRTVTAAVKAVAPKAPTVTLRKERIFAHPVVAKTPDSLDRWFALPYGVKRKDVRVEKLRVGSKVIAGTILGRIGTRADGLAPHLKFQIRPAGSGAPLIDPKPILDGYKLLESTAIYRASNTNPFYGADATNPSIGQVLLMSKEQLAQRVLNDPRIDIYPDGRSDIETGRIDRRVLATLEFLALSGLKPTVSSLQSGHGVMTASGNVSEHSSGNAVDISKINGIPILGHQGPGSITDVTIRRLLTLQGTIKPHQIISLMTFDGTDNTLSLPDHADHIHVGFRPLFGSNSKTAKQLNQILKPGQWIKLIDRLGAIDNPKLETPSGDR